MASRVFLDPPSGWRYGFPKSIPSEEYGLVDIREWLIDNGYPEGETDFAMKHIRVWTETDLDD